MIKNDKWCIKQYDIKVMDNTELSIKYLMELLNIIQIYYPLSIAKGVL